MGITNQPENYTNDLKHVSMKGTTDKYIVLLPIPSEDDSELGTPVVIDTTPSTRKKSN